MTPRWSSNGFMIANYGRGESATSDFPGTRRHKTFPSINHRLVCERTIANNREDKFLAISNFMLATTESGTLPSNKTPIAHF